MDARVPAPLSAARSLEDILHFDRFIAVGANSGGDQVRDWLTARGKEVIAFSDLSPSLHGTRRAGLDVLAPLACLDLLDSRTAFVIGTVRQFEAGALLTGELGIDPRRVFPFVNPMFAAHYAPGVQDRLVPLHGRIRSLLSDDASRAYFDRAMAFYRTLDPRHLTPQPRRIGQYGYDAPGANPRPGATIVDCGAFTGDSLPAFVAATKGDCRIHAIEAFPPNFRRLTDTIARAKLGAVVTPLPVALAREAGTIFIAGDESIADGCARVDTAANGYTVRSETLDDLFLGRGPVDYLKMDIEGADLDALIGGRRMLAEHRPVTAVAAYHKPGHAIEIAEFLHDVLAPCRIYAAHDPDWVFHIHYIAVPDERAAMPDGKGRER